MSSYYLAKLQRKYLTLIKCSPQLGSITFSNRSKENRKVHNFRTLHQTSVKVLKVKLFNPNYIHRMCPQTVQIYIIARTFYSKYNIFHAFKTLRLRKKKISIKNFIQIIIGHSRLQVILYSWNHGLSVAASPLNHKDIQLVVHLFCY